MRWRPAACQPQARAPSPRWNTSPTEAARLRPAAAVVPGSWCHHQPRTAAQPERRHRLVTQRRTGRRSTQGAAAPGLAQAHTPGAPAAAAAAAAAAAVVVQQPARRQHRLPRGPRKQRRARLGQGQRGQPARAAARCTRAHAVRLLRWALHHRAWRWERREGQTSRMLGPGGPRMLGELRPWSLQGVGRWCCLVGIKGLQEARRFLSCWANQALACANGHIICKP